MTDKNDNKDQIVETTALDSLKPASHPADNSMSKLSVITSVIGAMNAMEKEDLVKWFNDTMSQFGPNKDYGVGDNSGKNRDSISMNPSHAHSAGADRHDAMPKLSVKEDVDHIFSGSDLSEEFKEKASTLFEAAINARIMLESARLEEEFETQLNEAIEEINEDLSNKVDTYLDYVVENWMKENQVAIESTLRNEIAEEFIDGLKNLFAEHYIDVPQEKVDIIEALAEKVEMLEAKLNDQINENVEYKKLVAESEKEAVFESLCDDLAMSQQEKFKALAEGIDFDGDLETYARKLLLIRENYFSSGNKNSSSNITEETFEGEVSSNVVEVDSSVSAYAKAISRTIKK
jgi:hypothetical protein